MTSIGSRFWPTTTTANVMAVISVLAVLLALGTQPIATHSLVIVLLFVSFYTWAGVMLVSKVRPRRSASVVLGTIALVAAILIIGATRGWLFSFTNQLLEVEDPASLGFRVLNSTINTSVWAIAILAIESRIAGYRMAFREKLLYKQSQSLSKSIESNLEEAWLPGSEDLLRLQGNLKLIASDLRGQQELETALPIAATKIQDQISELLRPLSHRIWFNAEKNRPQFHISGLLTHSLRTLRINWSLTLAIGTGIFLIGALSLLSVEEALIRTMGYAAFLGPALFALSRLPSRRPRKSWLGLILLLGIATATNLVPELIASALLYGQVTSSYSIVAIAGPVATLVLLVLAAVLGQVDQDWKLIDSMLDNSEFSLSDTASEIRFASFLHNSLQSELNAIALTLRHVPDPNSPRVGKLLERLEQISSESITERFLASHSRNFHYLQRLVQEWEPLIAIYLTATPEIEAHPRLPILIELVEESISNAVRHAAAKEISIDASPSEDDIVVTISHPAANTLSRSRQLGSGWLNGYAKHHETKWQKGMRTLKVVL